MQNTEPIKIIEFQVENFMRINAARIEPDGSLFVVGGNNAQGKSSLLLAIEFAINGNKSLPEQPVKKGEDKARVLAKLSNGLVIERKTTRSGWGLSLTLEGVTQPRPQEILNKLFNDLCIDPLSFMRMKPADQVQAFKLLTGLDFTEIDQKRDNAFNARTVTNRRVKDLIAQRKDCHPGVPDEEESFSELNTELEARRSHNRSKQLRADDVDQVNAKIASLNERIESARLSLQQLESQRNACDETLATAKELVVEIGESKDEQEILERLQTVQDTNAKVRHNIEQAEISKNLKAVEDDAAKLTRGIEGFDDQRKKMISDVDCPVAGLSMKGGEVYFNDVALSQASSAQQLKVGFMMAEAMSPALRLCLIRDGSLLDPDSLEQLRQMAEKSGMQIIMERVGKEGCDVVIEDGSVEVAQVSEEMATDPEPAQV